MKITRKAGKIEALRQTVRALDNAQSKVGWFPSAMYDGGEGKPAIPVAGVAYVQEFGNADGTIPPRSFFRETATGHQRDWAKTVAEVTTAAANGHIAPSNIMESVALAAEAHVRVTITKIQSPALKDATIAARKRRLAKGGRAVKMTIQKPLVDTGQMLVTLTSEVSKK